MLFSPPRMSLVAQYYLSCKLDLTTGITCTNKYDTSTVPTATYILHLMKDGLSFPHTAGTRREHRVSPAAWKGKGFCLYMLVMGDVCEGNCHCAPLRSGRAEGKRLLKVVEQVRRW